MLIAAISILIAVPLLLFFCLLRYADLSAKHSAQIIAIMITVVAFILSAEYVKSHFAGKAFGSGLNSVLHYRR